MKGSVCGKYALRFDLNNRIGFDVDDVNVCFIELLVKVLFEGGPFGPKSVRWFEGSEDISFDRVVDAGADFLGPEVVGMSVGSGVEKHVFVGCEPEFETAGLPELFKEGLALFWRVICCVLVYKVEWETREGG